MPKLNIGSSNPTGEYKTEEWTNIDYGDASFSGNVIKMDACNMPEDWKDRFDEIRAIHVLEHINRNNRFRFVEECRRVLSPRGVLYIEVPDFEQVVRGLIRAFDEKDEREEHRLTTSIFGKQRYTGDQHCWGFTKRTLNDLIYEGGFNVEIFTGKQFDRMISSHFKQEPVLLAKATKRALVNKEKK